MMKITVLFILLIGAICSDVLLQKCYNHEVKAPKHLGLCYWTLTNLVAVFGFATQVFLPFTILEKLSKLLSISLWLYCVVGNCIFRIFVYYWREHYLHLIAGFWAFFNDANSWVLIPLIFYVSIRTTDTLINNYNSPSIQQKKLLLTMFSVFVSILVDVIEFSTDINGLAQWWVYATRIPIIIIVNRLIMLINDPTTKMTIKEIVIAVVNYNLLQICLNDMPFVAKNIMLKTASWALDAENHRILRTVFFVVYAVCFWVINNTAIKLVKLLEKSMEKSFLMLIVIFSFYDTYMMAMLVITNTDLDTKFFFVLALVIIRKILLVLCQLLDWIPEKFKTKTDLTPEEFKKNLLQTAFIKQINGLMCYTTGVVCYVVDYHASEDTWLGGEEKTFEGLLKRLFICNIYLGSELFISLILYIAIRYKKITVIGIKESIIEMYDNNCYFLWIVIYSYVIHIMFFWEPL